MKRGCVVNVMLGRGQGGIEQAVIDYSEALSMAGYPVHAIVDTRAAVKPALKAAGIPFSTLSNWGAWDIIAIIRLKRLLKKLKADSVIAHGNRALSLLEYAAGGCRLVTVMHNYKIRCKRAKRVFCPTRDLIRHVRQEGVKEEDVFLVPNMVRSSGKVFNARVFHTPPVIGSMGRFVSKKGFDVFIETLALLKERKIAFHALLGGSGEEEENLNSLAAAKGLGDTLTFIGWVGNKKPFFDAIDLFCLPSLHEPFGIVLLEAMAEGLPVIATATEGPSEIITHGSDGLLVEAANAVLLADAMEMLLQDRVQSGLMAVNALETVRKYYDIKVVSERMDTVLQNI